MKLFIKKCLNLFVRGLKWGFKHPVKLIIVLLVLAFIFGVMEKRTGEAGQKNQQTQQNNSALAGEIANLKNELARIKSETAVLKPVATASPTIVVVKSQPLNPIREVIYPSGVPQELGSAQQPSQFSEIHQRGRVYEVRDPNWRSRLDFETGIWTDLNWNTEFVSPPEVIIERMHNGYRVGDFRPFEQFRRTHPAQAEEILRSRRLVPDRYIHFNHP